MSKFVRRGRRLRLAPQTEAIDDGGRRVAMVAGGVGGAIGGTLWGLAYTKCPWPVPLTFAGCMIGGAGGVVTGAALHLLVKRPGHFAALTAGAALCGLYVTASIGPSQM